jgi:hypothetical protein
MYKNQSKDLSNMSGPMGILAQIMVVGVSIVCQLA